MTCYKPAVILRSFNTRRKRYSGFATLCALQPGQIIASLKNYQDWLRGSLQSTGEMLIQLYRGSYNSSVKPKCLKRLYRTENSLCFLLLFQSFVDAMNPKSSNVAICGTILSHRAVFSSHIIKQWFFYLFFFKKRANISTSEAPIDLFFLEIENGFPLLMSHEHHANRPTPTQVHSWYIVMTFIQLRPMATKVSGT